MSCGQRWGKDSDDVASSTYSDCRGWIWSDGRPGNVTPNVSSRSVAFHFDINIEKQAITIDHLKFVTARGSWLEVAATDLPSGAVTLAVHFDDDETHPEPDLITLGIHDADDGFTPIATLSG